MSNSLSVKLVTYIMKCTKLLIIISSILRHIHKNSRVSKTRDVYVMCLVALGTGRHVFAGVRVCVCV